MARGIHGINIAIIGAGHMGRALAKGLMLGGVKKSAIQLSQKSGTNARIAAKAGLIIIAVKPGVVPAVLEDIRDAAEGKAVVSAAAGVSLTALQKGLGRTSDIGRIMPNIPVASGEGVVGFYGGTLSGSEQKKLQRLFGELGLLVTARTEKELDALTLIPACGPALVSYFVDVFARSGKKLGLSGAAADAIAYATFAGALAYLRDERLLPVDLMRSVATKGGVTEAILKRLKAEGMDARFERALGAGLKKLKKK